MMQRSSPSVTDDYQYYVLVPLPCGVRENCLSKEAGGPDYILKSACDRQGRLTHANYSSMMDLGKSLLNRLKSSKDRNICPRVITFADVQILKNLKPDSILYVTAHGCPGLIGTEGEGIEIKPARLAKALKDAGLSQSLRTLKIMACDSAIDASNITVYGNSIESPALDKTGNKSYAENFLDVMKGLDYLQLDVAGYLGKVVDGEKAKRERDIHTYCRFFEESNSLGRASSSRLWFLSENTMRNAAELLVKNKDAVEFLQYINKM